MILVKFDNGAGVWLSGDESDLYRKIKFREKISADDLSEQQLSVIRTMINKSVISRKKENGKLYYTISSSIST